VSFYNAVVAFEKKSGFFGYAQKAWHGVFALVIIPTLFLCDING
jgi:hypothetical protein